MKSTARFFVLVVFAALLCFAPFAVGQGITATGNSVLSQAPSAFLTVGLGPGDHHKDWGDCGQGGNGGWDWFDGGRDNKGGCGSTTAVPEGGTSLMYLALAGLCCFGTMAYRMRRHESVARTNS